MNKEVIFLIGPPNAGKTTWRKKYAPYFKVISRDDIVLELSNGKDYNTAFKTVNQNSVNELLKSRSKTIFNNENKVVIDMTNMSRKSRKNWMNVIPDDFKKIAVYFEIDRKTLDERNKERNEKEGKNIPYNVMNDMLRNYERPTKTEGFEEIIRSGINS